MPFTPTHVAAILPLAWLLRWRLPLSALAIGSMICDGGVFFPGLLNYWVFHSPRGIFTHCLPLGLIFYFGFHWIVKRPFCALLPYGYCAKLSPWSNRMPTVSIGNLFTVALCISIGSASHIIWDSFTHYGRWGVETFPILEEVAMVIGERRVFWYTILQHGSSVICLPPMFLWTYFWLRRQPSQPREDVLTVAWYVKVLALITLITIPSVSYLSYYFRFPSVSQEHVIHSAVILAGSLLITIGLLYAVLFTIISLLQPHREIAQRND